MHTSKPSQTSSKSQERDAAIQISFTTDQAALGSQKTEFEMSLEAKFAQIAWHEGTKACATYPHQEAEAKTAGGIGMCAGSKEEFVSAGLKFLAEYESSSLEVIEDIRENDHGDGLSQRDEEVIDEIEILIAKSKLVDKSSFVKLLEEDWDERHEEEDE